MAVGLKQSEKKEFEIQMKLHINERLFAKGLITNEMYRKAKAIILAEHTKT